MATKSIYTGTASFASGSSTPFGHYDSDAQFQVDAKNTAEWCATRLGYPLVAIELQDANFFACFEEAVTEYSSQVNRFNIKENLLSAKGSSSGSNLTHTNVNPNLGRLIALSKQYGSEAGVGGDVSLYSGSLDVKSGIQTYDLGGSTGITLESGTAGTDDIEIRRVFHESSPAMTRFFDPHIGSGLGSQQMLSGFGWGSYSPAINYLMMPMYDDLLRVQAIEFNDMVRKSAYSFNIMNNRIQVFPKPTADYKMWFHYIKTADRNTLILDAGTVSDFSNIRYDNMIYTNINHPGKQWIRKYTLALVKELLGSVRSKFSSIPIPGAEVSMDGDSLRSEGSAEKEILITELREDLEQASRRNMMERENDIANFQQETINKIPLGIYIG